MKTAQKSHKPRSVVLFDRDPEFYVAAQLVLKHDFNCFCCTHLSLTLGILDREPRIDVVIFDYSEVRDNLSRFISDVRTRQPHCRLVGVAKNVVQAMAMTSQPEITQVILKTASPLELLSAVNEAAERVVADQGIPPC